MYFSFLQMWSQGGCIFPVAIQQSRCEYSLCFCLCFPFVWVLFHENGLWRVAVRTINYFVDYELSGDIWCVNPSPGNTHKILDIVPCPFAVTWQCPCLWPPLLLSPFWTNEELWRMRSFALFCHLSISSLCQICVSLSVVVCYEHTTQRGSPLFLFTSGEAIN